jgi:predicted cobalt transporter CbtA
MHQAENADSKDHTITPASIMYGIHHGEIESEIPATQYRRVLLKIDLVVMPLIVIAMTLAFLDKVFTPGLVIGLD